MLKEFAPHYMIHGRLVDVEQTDAIARMLMRDLFGSGISVREFRFWRQEACPFPHLRFQRPVLSLLEELQSKLKIDGMRCEPQFIFHPPDADNTPEPDLHVDQPPPWANGRQYIAIVGVAFTTWSRHNGTLRFRVGERTDDIKLLRGEVVMIKPDVPHSSGINASGEIRTGLYFRWLEGVADG